MKYKAKILYYLKYITNEKVLETVYRIVRSEFDNEVM